MPAKKDDEEGSQDDNGGILNNLFVNPLLSPIHGGNNIRTPY